MSPQVPPAAAVGLWAIAVAGAAALLLGPLTPWVEPVETGGLVVCVAATGALVVWFVRR
jgi:hypothetical protein